MVSDKAKKIVLLEKILRTMAKSILWKYKPKIVGITGSIGKTSAKEAVFFVLSEKFAVRKNEKNYNNEIGLPLTIIGAEGGGSSFLNWLWVFYKWLGVLIFPVKYPKVLVLEMGADRPGDIAYLTGFIKPEIGIITDISESHMEFFKSLEGIAKEKSILVKNLPKNGLAILNTDNEYVQKIRNQIKVRTLGFGFSEEADIRAEGVTYNCEAGKISGLSFKLNYKGTNLPVRLKNILAKHQIYAALAGTAVGVGMGMNLVEISEALQKFSSPPGRMNLIEGIKNSFIIDDTYNASPISTSAALQVLGEVEAKRKIAVLGDMLELGQNTESGHRYVAQKFLEIRGNIFVGVGSRMNFAVEELAKNNFPKVNIFHFKNSIEAGEFVQRIIEEGDLILVKGSQGARMEKVSEALVKDYNEAKAILCRQSEEWKKKPVKNV
jgi:UDP-N-acetylmuramoyl-tripeptide--D-alanyl-D-alanine ligase